MNTNSSAMSGMAQTEHTSKTRLNEFQKVIEEGEEVKEKVKKKKFSLYLMELEESLAKMVGCLRGNFKMEKFKVMEE